MTPKELIKKYKLKAGIHADYYEHFQSKKTVLTHRACETIANIEGITMDAVQVLNSERDFARFLVTMRKGDLVISSIGEADSKNCKNIYYGCMAEKRGVDRCVLKLIDAHDCAFSEVDFADHNEQSFENKQVSSKKSSTKGGESGNSPLPSSPAWREKKFTPLDTKIKNISRTDCFNWYKKKDTIKDADAKELIGLEYDYRVAMARQKESA
tara:strand:+ start:361 stop:993 length:633 start_codon:yes stop_codon:yes gene_type:complete